MKKTATLKEIGRRLAISLYEAVFPSTCSICLKIIDVSWNDTPYSEKEIQLKYSQVARGEADFRRVMAFNLCPKCISEFTPVESPICTQCGLMFRNRGGKDRLCNRCSMKPNLFTMARAYGTYDQSLKEAVHRYKYREDTGLADPFSLLLFSTFVKHWDISDVDIITPVPLHIKRFRKRGFNQAYLMFRKWHRMAEKMDTDISHIRFEKEIVIRTRATETQVGMDHKERTRNLKDAFRAKDISKIKGKRIVLVDDVLTTGSTANACVKEILRHGPRQVDVLTLAQTEKKKGF